MKKLNILLIALCLTGICQAQTPWDGSTKTKPTVEGLKYKVSTPAHLAWIADACATDENINGFLGKEIVMEADIDLNNKEWTPIGTGEKPFKGHFLGNNHTIKNLKINDASKNYAGLFGYMEGQNNTQGFAEIDSIYLKNVTITAGNYVGSLCGAAKNATMLHCAVNTSNLNGNAYVGGMAGYIRNASIRISYAKNITMKVTEIWGGLFVGLNDTVAISTLKISHCYAKGQVTCANYGGGFVGGNAYKGKIEHCYCIIQFAGKVADCHNLGLFCGLNDVDAKLTNCAYNSNMHGNMTTTAIAENKNEKDGETDTWSNTKDGMTSLAFYSNFTNESITKQTWKQDFSLTAGTGYAINEGTPILTWEYLANVAVRNVDEAQISVYPNPVRNILYIKANGTQVEKVEVMDLLGKTTPVENGTEYVDMSNYKAGVYLVRITTAQGVITKKVAKH
ncbi:MAG: T9SS type A sorting domain-containing protein [Bacteroidales bacterium]|nr:T9SS type A sorting domain-containing protein [Bacteroidales bacterium]